MTTLNLEVVRADAEQQVVLVQGAVPGPKGGVVLIRDAVKALDGRQGRCSLMPSVTLRTAAPAPRPAPVDLADDVFGIEPNVPVMHQVVVAQLAAKRSGTQSTKTRSEVAGGGAKPFKQKGTGRARAGSIRAPQWRGGGVALGPKPRNYDQKTPKKMKRLALRSALSDRAAEDKVIVVQAWDFDAPSTKDGRGRPAALGVDGSLRWSWSVDDDVTAWKSFRNVPERARDHPRRAQHLRRARERLRRVQLRDAPHRRRCRGHGRRPPQR